MTTDARELARAIITEFCRSDENRLWPESEEPAWAEPLVGFTRGDDPVFEEIRTATAPFHWSPLEAFRLGFPESPNDTKGTNDPNDSIDPAKPVEPADLAVIVWILPQTVASKQDNRSSSRMPAERWARSRIFGEEFNSRLREHVVTTLTKEGYPAVAPMCLEQFRTEKTRERSYVSTWSERHAAYAAGLGTFGLCDGLITPAGKAMRAGSVVAWMSVPPTVRGYTSHTAYCLHFSAGTCGECVQRCPVGAITEKGHDKDRCRAFLMEKTAPYVESEYGFKGYGCGLCQTGVPCESGIPEGITEGIYRGR